MHDTTLVPFQEANFAAGATRYEQMMFADAIHMSPEGNRFKADIFADHIAPVIAADLGVAVPEPSIYAQQEGGE